MKQPMKPRSTWLPCLLALASCGTPPKPPTVDPSNRRPANAAPAIDLQMCRSDLQNTRILAMENARAAQASGSTVALLVQQQAVALASGERDPSPAQGNTVHTVLFGFGSARVSMPEPELQALLDSARAAPLVVLRGRTDGIADSAADSRIARQRADAVRALLTQRGVDPARLRTTWQPYGDPAADNGTPDGRALNRRVEIEVYRSLPRRATSRSAAGTVASD